MTIAMVVVELTSTNKTTIRKEVT